MRVGIFGGSFDPVHSEHVGLVRAAIGALSLDRVLVMPSYIAPHKAGGASAGGEDRFAMCKAAFRALPEAEISDFELSAGDTSYSYRTCLWLKERFPQAERYFLLGADMLENFFFWKNPEIILSAVKLAACGRAGELPQGMHGRFCARFGCDFIEIPFMGAAVSSTRLRAEFAFGLTPRELDGEVLRYIRARHLYEHPAIGPALALETPARRAHSLRVAILASERARTFGVSPEKALLASALHDCGKYVSADSPLLAGFSIGEEVPEPVLHQFTGAYLAEHVFGVSDPDVLDAIRYHTSGREEMTDLGKIVFLADLLEPGRKFEGVEELRALFAADLDRCFFEALRHQVAFLKSRNKPVYPRTEAAYLWEKRKNEAK